MLASNIRILGDNTLASHPIDGRQVTAPREIQTSEFPDKSSRPPLNLFAQQEYDWLFLAQSHLAFLLPNACGDERIGLHLLV